MAPVAPEAGKDDSSAAWSAKNVFKLPCGTLVRKARMHSAGPRWRTCFRGRRCVRPVMFEVFGDSRVASEALRVPQLAVS